MYTANLAAYLPRYRHREKSYDYTYSLDWRDRTTDQLLRTDNFVRSIESYQKIWDEKELRRYSNGILARKDCFNMIYSEEWRPFRGKIFYPGGSYVDTYHEGEIDCSDLVSDPLETLRYDDVNLAMLKAASHVNSYNLSASVGEARETVSMFRQTLGRIGSFIDIIWKKEVVDALMAFLRGGIKAAVGASSSGWLEYNFGWRAMIHDAKALIASCEALNASIDGRYEVFRGKIPFSLNTTEELENYNSPAGLLVKNHWRRNVSYSATARASQLWCLNGGIIDPFGVMNLPSAAWELTRLSWALDYFLNIDDNIALLDPKIGWSYMGASISVKHKIMCTDTLVSCESLTSNAQIWEISNPQIRRRMYVIYDRGHTFDRPSVEFNFSSDLKTVQLANLFALVGQRWANARKSHPAFSQV